MEVNQHEQSGQPCLNLHPEEVEDDSVHYTNRIVQPQYDKTPSECHYTPLPTATTDAPPETTNAFMIKEQNSHNYMQERALPAQPHYAETEYPIRKSSSVSYKRCLGYIVVLLVVLMICSTAITLGYMFTTSAELRVKPLHMRSCPQPITVEVPDLYNSTTVFWNEPTAENQANGLSFHSHSPGDRFSIGSTEVLYTLIDLTGRKEACSFLVTVIDLIPPVVYQCPKEVISYVDSELNLVPVFWATPYAIDNSGNTTLINYSHTPGSLFHVGSTQVRYVFVDPTGNIALCTFTVTVIDLIPPVVYQCPKDVLSYVDSEHYSASVPWTTPYAIDNSGNVTVINSRHAPGSLFYVGSTQVRYVFADPTGNIALCTFTVTVIDLIPPVVYQCPKDYVDSTLTSVSVPWTTPYAIDNSGNVTLINSSHTPGSSFHVGSTHVQYVFADPTGNIALCTFTVTVLDLIPPVVHQCPKEVISYVDSELHAISLSWTTPYAIDTSGNVTLINSSHTPGSSFHVGSTQVQYVFADPTGNIALCTFTVTVIDLIPPVVYQCPKDVLSYVDSEHYSASVSWTTPYAIDNSGNVTLINCSHTPGSSFHVGSTQVRYVFTDPTGNIALCTFTVTVIDLNPPVVYQCSKEVRFYVNAKVDPVPVSWKAPYAKDNSGNVILISSSHTPGSFFHLGSTQVRYVFADPTGNIALCTFTVTGKLRSSPSSGVQSTSSRGFVFALIVSTIMWNWF